MIKTVFQKAMRFGRAQPLLGVIYPRRSNGHTDTPQRRPAVCRSEETPGGERACPIYAG